MPIDFTPISLDIETSTDNIETGTILSIGLVDFFNGESHEYNIRHSVFTIKPESMRVNQINVLEVDGADRLSMEHTDFFTSKWLEGMNYPKPFGMNVGTFDMQFVKKFLPQAFSVFGYRSIDLNALIFAKALTSNKDFRDVKGELKSNATLAVKNAFGGKEHDALFDAYTNCYVLAQVTSIYPDWMHGWRPPQNAS